MASAALSARGGAAALVSIGSYAEHGPNPAYTNKDVKPFLLYFLPKGQKPNRDSLRNVARTFHLAFKGMETEEIYDVRMEQLVSAVKGYDPDYKAKVKLVGGGD